MCVCKNDQFQSKKRIEWYIFRQVYLGLIVANIDVPSMDIVTECLLHEERKSKDHEGSWSSHEKAVTNWFKRNSPECFHCGKTGHIKYNYYLVSGEKKKFRPNHHGKQKANKATVENDSKTQTVEVMLKMVSHKVLSAGTPSKLIINSKEQAVICVVTVSCLTN